MNKLPFIFHDLQDSQMFAMAQAAGRAGFSVHGTLKDITQAPWVAQSRYIQKYAELPSLGDINQGLFALNLKKSGLKGVFVPMVDDIADLLAEFAPLLRKHGLIFLTAHPDQLAMTDLTSLQQWQGKLQIPRTVYCDSESLLKAADSVGFPVIIKSFRDGFISFANQETMTSWFESSEAAQYPLHFQQRVQQYIPGEVSSMASAIVLFDANSNPVRGFTARRTRVTQTLYGPFGETVSAKAEWIPDLYEAVIEIMSALNWVGFAEVECKQDDKGVWHLLEINTRLSGWACLAEADGAGFLQAYHHLCTEDTPLSHACLQRSQTSYSRMITSSMHKPDWKNFKLKTYQSMWNHDDDICFGAWDKNDSKANRAWIPSMFKRFLKRT